MADNRSGQQLGNYRLIRLLGQGGFADVYLGEHIYLQTQAAIKILQMRLTGEDTQGFLNEARTIASLRHPHIVRVLDFGVEGTTPFLVMDYAPLGTLRQRFPKGTHLPLANIVSYVKQVASALQFGHDRKVIHRDIKPENMLLASVNEILLSDFGIALFSQSSRYQNTQETAGTVAYMAPEQLQGKPRPASDQYSLGIVVYEWLSGDRPFHGTFTELYSQHLFVPPPPLSEKVPAISRDIEAVVQRALAKDPQQRFKTVQDFAMAFEEAYQAELPTFVTPPRDRPSQPHMRIGLPGRSSEPTIEATPLGHTVWSPVNAVPPHQVARQSLPSIPSNAPQIHRRSTSRRAVLLGLAGLAAGGGLVWLVSARTFLFLSAPGLTPTLTPIPPGTLLYTYNKHSDAVRTIAWSPDGRRIASGSFDNTVQVWDAADGRHIYTYRGHSSFVYTVAWSPDGRRIASSSWDKTVQVWDAADGGNVLQYGGHKDHVDAVAWSPDGRRIASGSPDKTVQIWDAADGRLLYTYRGNSDHVYTVAWSPDGRRIASESGDNTVQVWDAADGGNILQYPGHSSFVWSVAWSPDGRRIASGSHDQTVQVWDATNGRHIYTYHGHSSPVLAVAWSPDGRRIASGGGPEYAPYTSGDTTVQVWDATDGQHAFPYRRHFKSVGTVAWSPDGRRIASGSYDKTVQVWGAG